MWDKTPGMYCFARAGWNNQQVTKNCGVLPFLFHQMYGWRAVMAGPRIEADYPGLAYVPGLEMDFLADARTESALAYLEAHQMDIDVLVFHGVFPNYIPLAARYKELRPDGKIYLELDANAFYEDQLEWTKPEAMAFLQSCDVIGASCHAMQRHIGQKWPVVVEYLPNGFYDFTGSSQPMQAQNFAAKEKVLLSVGRIGSPEKQNEILLEAFAAVADRLPDWRVELVGPVEEGFRAYLQGYREQHPQAYERVSLPGNVPDKKRLYAYYRRAAVFVLTSPREGGTPNVVAEALAHGCYMLTTEIDAAGDVTDQGRCGQSFPIGDSGSLRDILLTVCPDGERLQQGGRHAAAYAQRNFDFRRIVARLHGMLMGEV